MKLVISYIHDIYPMYLKASELLDHESPPFQQQKYYKIPSFYLHDCSLSYLL